MNTNKLLVISPELHFTLKAYCAANGVMMKPFVENLIINAIKEKEGTLPLYGKQS